MTLSAAPNAHGWQRAQHPPSDAHVTDVTPFPSLNRPSYSEIREQNMSLKDKTVVVTGGSRGLGLGLVEALGRGLIQIHSVTTATRASAAR